MNFLLQSKAFNNNDPIPSKYTGEDINISPPLEWTNAPIGTKGFILVCDDQDAPAGAWVHWVLYDIPPSVKSINEAIPRNKIVLGSAKHGINDFDQIGYDGPMPPPGSPHRYVFKLYAVDKQTGLAPGLTKDEILKTIKPRIMAEAQMIGTYQR